MCLRVVYRTSKDAEQLCAPLDGNAAELLVLVLDDEGPARGGVTECVCACVHT